MHCGPEIKPVLWSKLFFIKYPYIIGIKLVILYYLLSYSPSIICLLLRTDSCVPYVHHLHPDLDPNKGQTISVVSHTLGSWTHPLGLPSQVLAFTDGRSFWKPQKGVSCFINNVSQLTILNRIKSNLTVQYIRSTGILSVSSSRM